MEPCEMSDDVKNFDTNIRRVAIGSKQRDQLLHSHTLFDNSLCTRARGARTPVMHSGCNLNVFLVDFDTKSLPICNTMSTNPLEQQSSESDVVTQEPVRVILFNDDVHTMEEVIAQLMKALRCTEHKAEALALDVHNNGKGVVFSGEILRCMEVSQILEQIQLMTQIEV
jgi:ATP-dependent Clp protease adaptor protein ClpS